MKKTLLAIAILTSFAGAASAQSSVTVYGLLDAGITSEHGGAAGSVTKLATGVESGNRLGFKGSEDLGNGLKANFQLENGFNLDTGTQRQGALFGRQAYVGLSGGFGAVNLGRQYDPIFVSMDSIDPFSTGLTGSSTNLLNPGNVRTNNAITYSSNSIQGFSANVLYGMGEVAGNNAANRTIGLSANYANGPVLVTFAYDRINAAASSSANLKLALLGATYNFGPALVAAAYETEKSDTAALDNRDYLLGVTVPVGPAGAFLASYMKKDDRISNKDGKQLAVGYTYALSKRTNVYTSYARLTNEAGGASFVGDASSGGTAVLPGNTSSAFTIGVRHKF